MQQYGNSEKLIEAFCGGETSGYAGASIVLSNIRIIDNQLVHYSTPILERYGDSYIFNITRYSPQTDRLQKIVAKKIDSLKTIKVNGVEMDYKGSLAAFIK